MLPLEFTLTDAHFAISMLAGLACFATMWLYLDAWSEARELKELLKWLGFGLLAVGFVAAAAQVEPAFLGQTVFAHLGSVGVGLRLAGYALLAIGLALDPLQAVPEVAEMTKENAPRADDDVAPKPVKVKAQAHQSHGLAAVAAGAVQMVLPVLAGLVSFLYWRRATTGLERHLKPVAWSFVWFTAYELVNLSTLARGTSDPRLYSWVAPFGPLWIVARVCLAVAAVILGRWVWQYLTKRVQTQLFMVLTAACISIFLVTTVSFTFLLMNRVQSQAFDQLKTTAKVLGTSIDGQQAKTTALAEVVAENPAVAVAVAAHDHAALAKQLSGFLAAHNQSSLMLTTEEGQVLLRAEDPANWGDSVSSDTLVDRAAVGKSTNGLVAATGALTPQLVMRSTTPVRDAGGNIVGTVSVGFAIDNAFVDGLKASTGLDSAMYSGPTRVATTLLAPDGKSRLVGVTETQKPVTTAVLTHNQYWSGLTSTSGRSYLAVYAPLDDVDNAPVGMLFVGEPQELLLQAAGRSIELTFLISVVLLLIAIWPVHLISRSLARQLH